MEDVQTKATEAVIWLASRPGVWFLLAYMAWNFFKGRQPLPETGGRVVAVTTMSEFKELQAKGTKICADFFATWCPPCRTAAPLFGEMSTKFEDVTFIKVDVDKSADIARACGIKSMPTFKVFHGETEVGTVVSWNPTAIEELLEKARNETAKTK